MGILILNKTLCPVCKLPIKESDEYFAFPAFVVNTKDPVYHFSDQTFHKRCLKQDKICIIAKVFAEDFIEKIKPSNRRCIIGGNMINEYENHIFIDMLTSDKSNFLHQFNFTHIDRRNLADWKMREELLSRLKEIYKSDLWQEANGGNYLINLIKKLS